MTNRLLLLALLAGLAIGACSTTSKNTINTADARDRESCMKMCEVAGSAEHNEGAVPECKRDCAVKYPPEG